MKPHSHCATRAPVDLSMHPNVGINRLLTAVQTLDNALQLGNHLA